MRTREWTIRARIFSLLVIPITSLIVLWVFATSLTVGSASNLLATRVNYEEVTKPAETLIRELQRERKVSIAVLRSAPADLGDLARQRHSTDEEVKNFRAHVGGERLRDSASAGTLRRIDDLVSSLKQLPGIRTGIDGHQIDRAGTLRLYSAMIERIFRVYYALPGIDENSIGRDSRTIIMLARAREYLSQENAVLSGIASAGHVEVGEPGQLAELIGTQRFLFNDGVVELPGRDQAAYRRVLFGDTGQKLRELEDNLVSGCRVNEALPIDMATWQATYQMLNQQLSDVESAAEVGVLDRARPVGITVFVRLGLAAIIGLIAIIASVMVSVRADRSIVRRLTELQRTVQLVATERLPSVLQRLRRGEQVDVAVEAPPLDLGRDEIGRVGEAFHAVQRTAVEAAAQEARTRAGLRKVFLNIARRNQTLLHRQLAQLDTMERKTLDPDQLQELFRVDHLATRMRRHAENLVVLAGATPARGWRNPVPLIDVIRGAVSEVEEYTRVTIQAVPEVAVTGPAVGDAIHLLAELIENATAFSPPNSSVTVAAQVVPKGLAIDLEDRGIGMPQHAIAEANERLASPADFDPETSARLGLFVVSTLAARHGVKVSLRSSAYDGITAVVLLPPGLIVSDQTISLPPIRQSTRRNGLTTSKPLQVTATPLRVTATTGEPGQRSEPMAGSNGRVPAPDLDSGPATRDQTPDQRAAEGDGATDQLTADGLPKRRRQAHLAPRLKESPPTGQVTPGQTGAQPRSPEQIRSTMSALQAGVQRGRRDADQQRSAARDQSVPGQPAPAAAEEPDAGPDTTPGED